MCPTGGQICTQKKMQPWDKGVLLRELLTCSRLISFLKMEISVCSANLPHSCEEEGSAHEPWYLLVALFGF